MQRVTLWFIGAMSAVGVALALLVGARVTRIVQSRETGMRWRSEALETKNRDLDPSPGASLTTCAAR